MNEIEHSNSIHKSIFFTRSTKYKIFIYLFYVSACMYGNLCQISAATKLVTLDVGHSRIGLSTRQLASLECATMGVDERTELPKSLRSAGFWKTGGDGPHTFVRRVQLPCVTCGDVNDGDYKMELRYRRERDKMELRNRRKRFELCVGVGE